MPMSPNRLNAKHLAGSLTAVLVAVPFMLLGVAVAGIVNACFKDKKEPQESEEEIVPNDK